MASVSRKPQRPRPPHPAEFTAFTDLDELDRTMRAPTLAQRDAWAQIHAKRILSMLSSVPLSDVPQRIWRLRLFQDGEYVLVTLAALTKQDRGRVSVVHGYNNPAVVGPSGPTTVVGLDLMPGYSTDEVVAFLRLDLVDPDTIDWRDDTHYYQIAIAGGDVIGSVLGRIAD